MELGGNHGERLRSMTIVNSIPAMSIPNLRVGAMLMQWYLATFLAPMDRLGRLLARGMFPKPSQQPLRDEFERRFRMNERRPYRAAGRSLLGWSVVPKLGEIACPSLIVSGDRDFFPLAFKREAAAIIPDCELVMVEDSGHVTPIDQAEAFNRRLCEFLAGVDANRGHGT